MPRALSTWRTDAAKPSLRPCWTPLMTWRRNCGSSPGPVPSREPNAVPTRSNAATVCAESASSFNAVWISSDRQPGRARLSAEAW